MAKQGLAVDLALPSHHAADNLIASASIVLKAPIPAKVIDVWRDTPVALRGPDLLRVKGILHSEGASTPCVFHGVRHVLDLPVLPEGDTTSRMVVLSRDIAKTDLAASRDMLHMRIEPSEATGGMTRQTLDMPF